MYGLIENNWNDVWVVSDHHFSHLNVIKYENRPFANTTEMDRFMVDKWNEVIKSEDIVLYLGDLTLSGNKPYLLFLLNGRKILIKGNHDRATDKKWREYGFEFTSHYLFINKTLFIHNPIPTNYPKNYKELDIKYIIHGHIHSKIIQVCDWYKDYKDWIWENNIKYFNVSVERLNYKPIKLKQIYEEIYHSNRSK